MSQETLEWLNANTLIGFTSRRGHAWHYRASDQGSEPNHYAGAIPVRDVLRRLFHWQPTEGTVETTFMTEEGVTRITDPDRKAIVRPDVPTVLGVFKKGYRIHDYAQWLLSNVASLLDDDLSIGSAGLLRGGAVAWVQVEVPETCSTPEGVEFRPFLSAATSLDGSLSTTYTSGATVVVCDNTLSAALTESGAKQVKIRHSRNSLGRIAEARQALGIVHRVADDFAEQVRQLCQVQVSERAWSRFLDKATPAPAKPGRSRTLAERRRDDLENLWSTDLRVAPWRGTAYGVVAAVNTYTHHLQQVRSAHRAERNMERAVTGQVHVLDQNTLHVLDQVLGGALTAA
jgi:phage/plasmid-like protein (TIGR03299 family)